MWDRTLTAWGGLQDTARPFPTDAKIQSELALGAGDLIAYCEGAGRRDLLDQTWQLLATTGAPPISSRRTFHYLHARDSAKMDNAWIWLEKENARFPGHPEIWPLLRDAPFSPYKIYWNWTSGLSFTDFSNGGIPTINAERAELAEKTLGRSAACSAASALYVVKSIVY